MNLVWFNLLSLNYVCFQLSYPCGCENFNNFNQFLLDFSSFILGQSGLNCFRRHCSLVLVYLSSPFSQNMFSGNSSELICLIHVNSFISLLNLLKFLLDWFPVISFRNSNCNCLVIRYRMEFHAVWFISINQNFIQFVIVAFW